MRPGVQKGNCLLFGWTEISCYRFFFYTPNILKDFFPTRSCICTFYLRLTRSLLNYDSFRGWGGGRIVLKALGLRNKGSGVWTRVLPLGFQRLGISCFKFIVWLKYCYSHVKSSKLKKQLNPTNSSRWWISLVPPPPPKLHTPKVLYTIIKGQLYDIIKDTWQCLLTASSRDDDATPRVPYWAPGRAVR